MLSWGRAGATVRTICWMSLHIPTPANPKIILGFSDLTSLQIYLWQRFRWITFYGPMLAAGLDAGAGAPKGYDDKSLLAALQNTGSGWALDLQGEALNSGEARGRVLGGCLTLVETAIGTQWDLQTDDAHSCSGRSRNETMASGSGVDASETSGEICERARNCTRRFSGVRRACGRQSDGARCVSENTRADWHPDCF